jgi:hypothetical protein
MRISMPHPDLILCGVPSTSTFFFRETKPRPFNLAAQKPPPFTGPAEDMIDEDWTPMFAFQHLDYIPFGFSSDEAPYIESGPGTMRAAAALMRLNLGSGSPSQKILTTIEEPVATVVCDLGCGDGEFRTDKLRPHGFPQFPANS